METLIYDADTLRRYIPNVIRSVEGEIPLYDKLLPFLNLSQEWLCAHFVPADMLDGVVDVATHIVAVDAYRMAIPQLDLVLTQNGFATVGSQNLVPASKLRTDRLLDGLLKERDAALSILIRRLPGIKGWMDSAQGRWFSGSLFPFLDDILLPDAFSGSWDKFLEMRPLVENVERDVAERWISPELMAHLRVKHLAGDLSKEESEVVSMLRPVIMKSVQAAPLDVWRLSHTVDFIRKRPGAFPLWVSSETAGLFSPPVFRNKKDSAGYFF